MPNPIPKLQRAIAKARKADRREAINYECMSKIIMHAQDYIDGRAVIGATVACINVLVRRIVEEHVK